MLEEKKIYLQIILCLFLEDSITKIWNLFQLRGGLMLKTRSDFSSEKEYVEYTRSLDFLLNYSLEGKTAKQIQEEMRIDEDWLYYVEKALSKLKKKGEMKGIDMVRMIDIYVIDDEDYEGWLKRKRGKKV